MGSPRPCVRGQDVLYWEKTHAGGKTYGYTSIRGAGPAPDGGRGTGAHGQGKGNAPAPVRPGGRRPCAAGGRARHGQDGPGPGAGPAHGAAVQPHSGHAGPAALGRDGGQRAGHADGSLCVPQGAGVHPMPAGGRIEPGHAPHPGGAVGMHGGMSGHRRGRHLSPAPALLCAGHAKPH